MKTIWRKATALTLTLVYTSTNVALNSIAESNVWAERKTQLAALPGLRTFSTELFPRISQPQSRSPLPSKHSALPPETLSLADKFPPGTVDVQRIEFPDGAVKGVVFHLYDIHATGDAQKKISALIQSVSAEIPWVGAEGSFDRLSIVHFRDPALRPAVARVANRAIESGQMSGVLNAALVGSHVVNVEGIDDSMAFRSHWDAVRITQALRSQVEKDLSKRATDLELQKQTLYPKELRAFDQLVSGYENGSIDFASYVQQLSDLKIGVPSSVKCLQNVLSLEKTLDFEAVSRERSWALAQLLPNLSSEQVREINGWILQLKAGQLDSGIFHERLTSLFERVGVDLRRYVHFMQYLHYVSLAESIDSSRVLSDLHLVERKYFNQLALTPETRRFPPLPRDIAIIGRKK